MDCLWVKAYCHEESRSALVLQTRALAVITRMAERLLDLLAVLVGTPLLYGAILFVKHPVALSFTTLEVTFGTFFAIFIP